MKEFYSDRRKKVSSLLAGEGITLLVLCDREGMRNANIRYLTGHPSDAVLFIFADGESILLPWDMNLAEKMAFCDSIRPYNDYGRDLYRAVMGIIGEKELKDGAGIELPALIPYPEFMKYKENKDFRFICRDADFDAHIKKMRRIKDKAELDILRAGAAITDDIINKIEAAVRSGDTTEADIALLIDREARLAGAEGLGFETLVAGPGRSNNIHAFPSYTGASFPGDGLSIIDFGVRKDGYTTDVTLTITRNLSREQQQMVLIIENTVKIAEKCICHGASINDLASAVSGFIKANGYEMPHSLGHGIGLDIHEMPFLNKREADTMMEAGMVFTIEPGIYTPTQGGIRLENDYLVTKQGFERLTNSRLIRL